LNADGHSEAIAWTMPDGDDGFLALDRDGDGAITNGTELFGNATPQPPSEEKNGFLALAVWDTVAAGGNNDRYIDNQDAVYSRLRLWVDEDHNGLSRPSELRSLLDAAVYRFDLRYHESRRRDEFGNWFRYRAKVFDSIRRTRWAWDVILTIETP
jgi:hypothetical protein